MSDRLRAYWEAALLPSADEIVAISRYMRDHIERLIFIRQLVGWIFVGFGWLFVAAGLASDGKDTMVYAAVSVATFVVAWLVFKGVPEMRRNIERFAAGDFRVLYGKVGELSAPDHLAPDEMVAQMLPENGGLQPMRVFVQKDGLAEGQRLTLAMLQKPNGRFELRAFTQLMLCGTGGT